MCSTVRLAYRFSERRLLITNVGLREVPIMQTSTNDSIGESSPALSLKLAQLEFIAIHFNGDLV
jgi:hypothetical protein